MTIYLNLINPLIQCKSLELHFALMTVCMCGYSWREIQLVINEIRIFGWQIDKEPCLALIAAVVPPITHSPTTGQQCYVLAGWNRLCHHTATCKLPSGSRSLHLLIDLSLLWSAWRWGMCCSLSAALCVSSMWRKCSSVYISAMGRGNQTFVLVWMWVCEKVKRTREGVSV